MKFKFTILSLLLVLSGLQIASAQTGYQEPSQAMTNLVDGARTPSVSLSPDGDKLLLLDRPGRPSIEEVSQPELRLAGRRINPRTNGPSRASTLNGITIRDIESGDDIEVTGLPDEPKISDVSWSPNSKMIAFLVTKETGIELWKADVNKAKAEKVADLMVNDTYGSPYMWMRDSKGFLVQAVLADRGEAPTENNSPTGPVIEESTGKAAPGTCK